MANYDGIDMAQAVNSGSTLLRAASTVAREATLLDKVRERIAEAIKLGLDTRGELVELSGRLFGPEPPSPASTGEAPSQGVADDILNALSVLTDICRDNMVRSRGLNQRL